MMGDQKQNRNYLGIILCLLVLLVSMICWVNFIDQPNPTETPTNVAPTKQVSITPFPTKTSPSPSQTLVVPSETIVVSQTKTPVSTPTSKPVLTPTTDGVDHSMYWHPCVGIWIKNAAGWIDPNSCRPERDSGK